MAGIANPNYKTHYQGIAGDRGAAGVFGTTDWAGGVNKGGSNAPYVGLNTGDYDPKVTDWSQNTRNPAQSQTIGHALGNVVTTPDGVNDNARFIQATANVAPDGEFPTTTGSYNRTGKTVPSGSWCWAHIPVT